MSGKKPKKFFSIYSDFFLIVTMKVTILKISILDQKLKSPPLFVSKFKSFFFFFLFPPVWRSKRQREEGNELKGSSNE